LGKERHDTGEVAERRQTAITITECVHKNRGGDGRSRIDHHCAVSRLDDACKSTRDAKRYPTGRVFDSSTQVQGTQVQGRINYWAKGRPAGQRLFDTRHGTHHLAAAFGEQLAHRLSER
jgi:hypothetical protein